MPYFAVLHQYEFNNQEIIISQRKKTFIVLQLLKYNKTVKNQLFRVLIVNIQYDVLPWVISIISVVFLLLEGNAHLTNIRHE